MRFKKLPDEVEAVRLPVDISTPDPEWNAAIDFVHAHAAGGDVKRWWVNNDHGITVGTLRGGDVRAVPGDWIVQTDDGDLRVMTDTNFRKAYQQIE